jgi:hypothetical protein
MTKTMLYGATKVDETNSAYAAAASLEQFQWKNRVLVVFSTDGDPRGESQVNELLSQRLGLTERDMVVLRVRDDVVHPVFGDSPHVNVDDLRRDLEAPDAAEFGVVLIGKDGTVKLRVSEPIAGPELFSIVDSLPMRAAEATRRQESED